MPRYHFNVYDGIALPDHEGTELPNLDAARREALKVAEGLITSPARREDLGEEWRLEITNEAGVLLFRMDFIVTEIEGTPAFFPT